MFHQLSAEILPSLIKGRPPTTTTNNNNKAKCIPGGTMRVLAGKNDIAERKNIFDQIDKNVPSCRNQNKHAPWLDLPQFSPTYMSAY
jgi:hypothetical protein